MSRYRLVPEVHLANPIAFCSYEAYDALKKLEAEHNRYREALQWLRDGIDHFNNDEDREQAEYLMKEIDRLLAPDDRSQE